LHRRFAVAASQRAPAAPVGRESREPAGTTGVFRVVATGIRRMPLSGSIAFGARAGAEGAMLRSIKSPSHRALMHLRHRAHLETVAAGDAPTMAWPSPL